VTLRPRFALAGSAVSGPGHALQPGQTAGPSLCARAEPPGRWVLSGFTARTEAIRCEPCRDRAVAIVGTWSAAPDPNDFGPLVAG